jgi:DNA polymerase I-like protein with 3'-5' exonuclease and polymerase domains
MELVRSADPIIKELGDNPLVSIDTETSSLKPWRDGRILAGIVVKPFGGESFYLPFRHKHGGKQAPLRELKRLGKALRGRELIFHNPKFDLAVLWQDGLDLSDEDIVDTVVLIRLVSEDEPNYELKRLGKKYISEDFNAPEQQLKAYMRKMGWKTYDQVPAEYMVESGYVENDVDGVEFLYNKAMPYIEARGLEELLEQEKELTKRLFHVERHGFQLDRKYVKTERKNITDLVDDLEDECNALANKALKKRMRELSLAKRWKELLALKPGKRADAIKEHDREERALLIGLECLLTERKVTSGIIKKGKFDMYSPHDVRKVFQAMGIHSDVKTKKGAESWAKTALAVIDHPLADVVVKTRGAKNIKNYYVSFEDLMDEDGVIHCSLHQAGTRTGRLSCREPNLQNVPRFEAFTGATTGAIASMKRLKKRTEEKAQQAKEHSKKIAFDSDVATEILSEFEGELFGKVRGAFIPRKDCFLLSVDWQQIEIRILADYAAEDELLRTFDLGLDIHRMTALAAFGELPDPKKNEQMYKWVRNMGKQIAFGLLYGMGIALLAIEIGKSKAEAQEFMDRYFARFKHVKKWINQVHLDCEGKGFVANLWGRRRYLPNRLVYRAVNFLIQGTAADLMKDALVRVYDAISEFRTKILVTIHDEIVFEVPYAEAKTVIPIIIAEMEKSDRIKAKLRCDAAWAPERWSQMYEDKYSSMCDLGCSKCSGKGQLVNLPDVPTDRAQDTLLTALYENDMDVLHSAEIDECTSCKGKGYDLSQIKKPKRAKARA